MAATIQAIGKTGW
jgi:DNA-directed RNA polymerase sigma subunit (sigma70/sigma32)